MNPTTLLQTKSEDALACLFAEDTDMKCTLTTTWTSAAGTHSICTTREEGETPQELAARHIIAVASLQATYPKV